MQTRTQTDIVSDVVRCWLLFQQDIDAHSRQIKREAAATGVEQCRERTHGASAVLLHGVSHSRCAVLLLCAGGA